MRLFLLLPLALFAACGGEAPKDDSGDTEADADTDTDTDTDTDSDTDADTDTDTDSDVDTAIAQTWWEGSATFTVGGDWSGEESLVGYSYADGAEMCRVTNATTGTALADTCEGCTWAFEITTGAGTMAGDRCSGLGWADDMLSDFSFLYGFTPRYEYDYNGTIYAYDNVLMYGFDYYGTLYWTPFAYGEDESVSSIVYRSIFPGYQYYYYY
jgi:hypothetical protein